jgi:hypothetical protein
VWKTTPWTWLPRAATAISIASVTSEVRMWCAIDQPITRREQMSMTVARYSQVAQAGTFADVQRRLLPGVLLPVPADPGAQRSLVHLYLSGDLGDRAGFHDHHLDRLVPKFRT